MPARRKDGTKSVIPRRERVNPLGLIREDDIDGDDLVAMVKAWRRVRDVGFASPNVDAFRDAERGRVFYPLSGDESAAEAADRLDALQAELMTELRRVGLKLGKSWGGSTAMAWVPVGGFLQKFMEREDSEIKLVYEAELRDGDRVQ